ncbi:MAG: hypothetical protein K8J31_22640 [Anaerolineae bacterium]|nr:hypothetical protein [Anaerolineae bacterium]
MTETAADTRVDRLLDAIELIKQDRRDEARALLRGLVNEDGDFEDAWLWLSVAVDSLDQSSVCLDNVLRVNPRHAEAAGALYRIRMPEMVMDRRRTRLRLYRDLALGGMWALVLFLLYGMLFLYFDIIPA